MQMETTTPTQMHTNSNVNNTGAYVSNEFDLLIRLKTIVGVRLENYVQKHTGRDQRYASGDTRNGRNLDNEAVLESLDFFPSLNLIYALKDQSKLTAVLLQNDCKTVFQRIVFCSNHRPHYQPNFQW